MAYVSDEAKWQPNGSCDFNFTGTYSTPSLPVPSAPAFYWRSELSAALGVSLGIEGWLLKARSTAENSHLRFWV